MAELIRREDVLKAINLHRCDTARIEESVLQIKVVEERKQGEWIYDKNTYNWRCSVCDETPKTMGFVGTKEFMNEHFKFCNHCGAKMIKR